MTDDVSKAYAEAIRLVQLEVGGTTKVRAVAQAIRTWNDVVITGVGKSYEVARRGAATMRSLGIHAQTYDATSMLHGDLGVVHGERQVVIGLSNSGFTAETIAVTDVAVRRGAKTVAVCEWDSHLAQLVECVFPTFADELPEGNTVGAPMASCVVQALWLDKIAAEAARTLSRDQFKMNHPGGTLGREV